MFGECYGWNYFVSAFRVEFWSWSLLLKHELDNNTRFDKTLEQKKISRMQKNKSSEQYYRVYCHGPDRDVAAQIEDAGNSLLFELGTMMRTEVFWGSAAINRLSKHARAIPCEGVALNSRILFGTLNKWAKLNLLVFMGLLFNPPDSHSVLFCPGRKNYVLHVCARDMPGFYIAMGLDEPPRYSYGCENISVWLNEELKLRGGEMFHREPIQI